MQSDRGQLEIILPSKNNNKNDSNNDNNETDENIAFSPSSTIQLLQCCGFNNSSITKVVKEFNNSDDVSELLDSALNEQELFDCLMKLSVDRYDSIGVDKEKLSLNEKKIDKDILNDELMALISILDSKYYF